ncbi:tail fiber domain-containing protein [Dyadobacter sp. LJ53]|uniref:tail fiber domain-containing protein n=1 Tax=Dyadobacter chenwenxiniae TaxID=2906456 RepID=UPI001F1A5BDA|nr:tail fiber domain-containing protein [Dyadobacter chenwenxiniae]MCF0048868.1 tail fiber domain-containing protein [Dyadobacter chenwenxiniae]
MVGGAGGDLSVVDWKSDVYFLKVELDPDGGSNFTDLGATQMVSVPYALHAEEASRLKNDDPVILKGVDGNGAILPNVGTGNRLIWYPRKGAFRAGYSNGAAWEEAKMGQYSIAFGIHPEASGENSISLGKNARSLALNAFALGEGAGAMEIGAIAIGSGSSSTGSGGISIGSYTKATNSNTLAMGLESEATGNRSIAIGFSNKASGNSSFAAGYRVTSKAYRGVALGVYNWIGDNPNPESPAATDRIFQIGNGTSENARSNVVTIMRNGNIGLGNNIVDPQFPLDIAGRARIRNNGATAGIYLDASQSAAEGFVGMKTDNEIGLFISGGWRFWVNPQGNGYLNGNLIQTSDRRLKTKIQPFKNSLGKVSNLQGYHYNWEDKTKDQTLQTGLIAQEVEQIFPELVSTNKDGFKSVNYIGLVPHLIESVKELKRKTDEIAVLRKELEGMRELGKRLELLEASVNKGTGLTEIKSAAK